MNPFVMKRYSKILLIIYIGVLLFLYYGNPSISKDIPPSFLSIPIDKVAHFVMMMPLSVLLFFSFARKYNFKSLSLVSFASLLFVTILEYTQSFINPLRESDLYDLIANYASIVFVTIILSVILLSKH